MTSSKRQQNICCLLLFTLLDFLFQTVEKRGGEEFAEGDLQTVAEHFDGQQFGILAFTVEDIFNAGRGKSAYGSQFIDRHVPLLAKLQNASLHSRNSIHLPHLRIILSYRILEKSSKNRLCVLLYGLYIDQMGGHS